MKERNALFKELLGLGLYQISESKIAESEVKVDPTDVRIDVRAKFSLQRMLKQGGDAAQDAEGMVTAINTGRLLGIFGDDLYRSVQIARKLGTQRWLLIPKGKDAELVRVPAEPPTIIFRDGLDKDKNRFDIALRNAWHIYSTSVKRPKLPVLKYGDKGKYVRYLQKLLNKKNYLPYKYNGNSNSGYQNSSSIYSLSTDGIFGLLTEKAVMAFQENKNLIPNGIVGLETWDFLQTNSPANQKRPFFGCDSNFEIKIEATGKFGFGFCMQVGECGFIWSFECNKFVLPAGQSGTWTTGFIQNSLEDSFEIKYLLDNQPRTYTINQRLLDTNNSSPFMAIGMNPRKLINPQTHTISSNQTVMSLKVGYADTPFFLVDATLNGNPKNPIEYIKRKLVFQTFLVSKNPSGEFLILAFSELYTLTSFVKGTFIIDDSGNINRKDYKESCDIVPMPVPMTIVTNTTSVPPLVTTGTLSNEESRKEFNKLKINSGACALNNR